MTSDAYVPADQRRFDIDKRTFVPTAVVLALSDDLDATSSESAATKDVAEAPWMIRSMTDDTGTPVSKEKVVERGAANGSLVVQCAAVERDDVTTWRRRLRQLARGRGMRISVRSVGARTYVIDNPDYVATSEQLRATVQAMPVPTEPVGPRTMRPVGHRGRTARLQIARGNRQD